MTSVPVFSGLETDAVKEICLSLKQINVLKDDLVYREGQPARAMSQPSLATVIASLLLR